MLGGPPPLLNQRPNHKNFSPEVCSGDGKSPNFPQFFHIFPLFCISLCLCIFWDFFSILLLYFIFSFETFQFFFPQLIFLLVKKLQTCHIGKGAACNFLNFTNRNTQICVDILKQFRHNFHPHRKNAEKTSKNIALKAKQNYSRSKRGMFCIIILETMRTQQKLFCLLFFQKIELFCNKRILWKG